MLDSGRDDTSASAPEGRAFWTALFGNDAPVEIEIGSGDGSLLLARATAAPDRNLLGIERAPGKAERLATRMARLRVPRVRTLHADATYVLRLVPAASVAAYHAYFPDPWPKRRHVRRRIFTAPFVRALARTLVDEGELYVATDVTTYMHAIRAEVLADGAFVERPPGDDHPGLATAFARKYRVEGRALHLGRFCAVGTAADRGRRPGSARCGAHGVEDEILVVP